MTISSADLQAMIASGQLQPSEYTNARRSKPVKPDPEEDPPQPTTRRLGGRPSKIGKRKKLKHVPQITRGMVRYVAQIDGHGFVKKETVNGVEELTITPKRMTATRFRSHAAAKDAAIAWGKLKGEAFLRGDINIIERPIL